MKEKINPLTIIKLSIFDKFESRHKEYERVKTTRWSRKYIRVAEWYWFWEVKLRGFGYNYIPLTESETFDMMYGLKMIKVPELIFDESRL